MPSATGRIRHIEFMARRNRGIITTFPWELFAIAFRRQRPHPYSRYFPLIGTGIPGTVPEIVAGMIDMVREDYCFRLQCKPGVSDVIRELHQQNVPLYIATATDRDMIEAALTRLELDSCFKGIITCGELGVPNTRPDIYRYAAKELGTRPEETLVFEDVLHAVRTASSASFPVVSVYDRESASDRDEMEALSVLYLNSFGAWPGIRTV